MRLLFGLMLGLVFYGTAFAEDQKPLPAERESPAAQRAVMLDKLFGKLHSRRDPEESRQTELEIWQLWARNDSPTAEVLLSQASIAMQLGDYEPAEQILVQLIETYPDFAEAWNRRATLYYVIKRYDASLIDIDHVLELEPRHFGALSGKGMVLRAQGKTPEALRALKEALEINPNMVSVEAAIKEIEKAEPEL